MRPHRFGDEQIAGFGAVVERVEIVMVDVDQIDGGVMFQKIPGRVVGAAMAFEDADACAFEVLQCELCASRQCVIAWHGHAQRLGIEGEGVAGVIPIAGVEGSGDQIDVLAEMGDDVVDGFGVIGHRHQFQADVGVLAGIALP